MTIELQATHHLLPPLLSINGLSLDTATRSGWRTIVDDISFDVNAGELVGIIGESGAGKTTLGLAAMGYARPGFRFSAGKVLFEGVDLLTSPERYRQQLRGQKIAYMAQNAATALNPARTIGAQLTELPVQHGVCDEKTATSLAETLYSSLSLPNPTTIGKKYPHQLSGGQQQRAMLAMAMACNPRVVVFDEPTSALDVTTQAEAIRLIKATMERYGTSGIYITHDIAIVSQIADRLIVLKDGKIVESGNRECIVRSPNSEYTRRLISVHSSKSFIPVPDHSDEITLSVRDLTVRFGRSIGVERASICVRRGQTLAVIGESGSGKTTLARAISGLRRVSEGEMLFKGQHLPVELKRRSKEQLRLIQLISQSPDASLNPSQTIGLALRRQLYMHFGVKGSKADIRVRELLRLVELDADAIVDRYPSQLSGGQRQRVCIARALAAEPSLLVCDEITSALDPIVADEILKLLQVLQKELHLSCLFITHDFHVLRKVAHELIVMFQGKIVESGAVEDVTQKPRHAYTKKMIEAVPSIKTSLRSKQLPPKRRQ